MFTSRQSPQIGDNFFESELPEKYHWAIDRARQETLYPLIYNLINNGEQQGLFELEEVEISCTIVSMGFDRYLHYHTDKLVDIEYHRRFLRSAEYLLNNILNPTKLKFQFEIIDN